MQDDYSDRWLGHFQRHVVEKEKGQATDPERELLIAVLEQAIADFLYIRTSESKTAKRREKFVEETRRWLLKEDKTWPYSFYAICENLALNPKAVRTKLFFTLEEMYYAHMAGK